jgi:hypothetical protein
MTVYEVMTETPYGVRVIIGLNSRVEVMDICAHHFLKSTRRYPENHPFQLNYYHLELARITIIRTSEIRSMLEVLEFTELEYTREMQSQGQ